MYTKVFLDDSGDLESIHNTVYLEARFAGH